VKRKEEEEEGKVEKRGRDAVRRGYTMRFWDK
jgi:hypothetical protein